MNKIYSQPFIIINTEKKEEFECEFSLKAIDNSFTIKSIGNNGDIILTYHGLENNKIKTMKYMGNVEKYRIKRLFKLKGYFLSRTKINESIYTFMLYKGQGNKRKHYQFTTRDIETIKLRI